MLLTVGCPEFEYDGHPNRNALTGRSATLIAELRKGAVETLAAACDTRTTHERLFQGLTPVGYEYYAGHYRGEDYTCLRDYEVRIPGDPLVGDPPNAVAFHLQQLSEIITTGLGALDSASQDPRIPDHHKLYYVVAFMCRVFVEFLRIHPYANGNGHAARFISWAILGRYAYWPNAWPIEPRPSFSRVLNFHRTIPSWQASTA